MKSDRSKMLRMFVEFPCLLGYESDFAEPQFVIWRTWEGFLNS